MKKVNEEYEVFKKMLAREIGLDETDARVAMLMSKLKRVEGKLRRVYLEYCNTGALNVAQEYQIHKSVYDLLHKYKTIKVTYNSDPRGGAIRLIFTKTNWYNTMGSDVAINW